MHIIHLLENAGRNSTRYILNSVELFLISVKFDLKFNFHEM